MPCSGFSPSSLFDGTVLPSVQKVFGAFLAPFGAPMRNFRGTDGAQSALFFPGNLGKTAPGLCGYKHSGCMGRRFKSSRPRLIFQQLRSCCGTACFLFWVPGYHPGTFLYACMGNAKLQSNLHNQRFWASKLDLDLELPLQFYGQAVLKEDPSRFDFFVY